MSVEIHTLGCRLNIAESEEMRGMLAGGGELVVVNSCAVTREAVRQTRQTIRRARKANLAKIRTLLGAEIAKPGDPPSDEIIPLTLREPCPDCGGAMRIIEAFRRGQKPRCRAPPIEQAA